MKSDTIAAVATALSDSGIGIIRVSGNEAISIVDKIYKSKGKEKLTDYRSHTIHYGFIYDEGELVDEVMVSVFKAPRSYTTEDTVEINCHGGVLVVRRILDLVIKKGARISEPGEFTKRAFLNGRIDLSRAEAVMDIIHAKNDFALKSSVKQIRGSLYSIIKKLRDEILYEIAFIESALDDPEHISLDGYQKKLLEKNDSLIDRVNRLYLSADNGRLMKEGINTVILGKPNAGKSSLLNLLVGEEKAIVTDIAGTTRDVIEERISLSGIGLNIIDTAGIRKTEDVVEKIGVEKAKNYALDADLIIYVVDSSVPLDDSDEEILNLIYNKKIIILLNKTDLESVISEKSIAGYFINQEENIRIIKTSTKEGIGIDSLEESIKEMFFHGQIQMNDEVVLTNLRQKDAVKDALDSLMMVRKSLENEMPEDFLSIDLMGAYSSLGLVIGEEVEEDVVNEIFSKFCMGK
ncbi:MAG: tRNA uridine-5-carboxymethylaminomethyl(34) synthesis GTPase MnmE [Lachnospiraceae bacterium]|nr:tRNA uridine-5-carboxymethylaminomethyl(34) synthesis GTPase MnmE [Lachnospiraceae bacterium]MDD7025678.1 tRNA uridine-5-carboxymethylaminomethyl(34) synthesis GTPase MnmE [Lachnospiraceae bacterium]